MSIQTDSFLIDSKAVNTAFLSCLYRPEELKGIKGTPEGAVIVEGIEDTFKFHPERLLKQQSKVKEWLRALPHQFRDNKEAGWSFLNGYSQENGVSWTDLYRRVEELFCLAIGLGLAKYQAPRKMWKEFSGGMPFIVIFIG